jgi:hypothetical protein
MARYIFVETTISGRREYYYYIQRHKKNFAYEADRMVSYCFDPRRQTRMVGVGIDENPSVCIMELQLLAPSMYKSKILSTYTALPHAGYTYINIMFCRISSSRHKINILVRFKSTPNTQ